MVKESRKFKFQLKMTQEEIDINTKPAKAAKDLKKKAKNCNSVYIGKTKRHLLVRQYEHLGLSVFKEKALKYTEKDATAIRKHCHQNEHRCSVYNFEIVGTDVNDFHLKLKESLLILKMKPCLNIAQESMPLYLFVNDS